MTKSDKTIYLICTRGKRRQKKHVAVCGRCRWQTTCGSYQAYRRIEASGRQNAVLTSKKKPSIDIKLLKLALKELKEIKRLLAVYKYEESKTPVTKIGAASETEFLLQHLTVELTQIKSLLI